MAISFTGFGQNPIITSFSPASGYPGTAITIVGSGFQPLASNMAVFIGNMQVPIATASSSQITIIAPTGPASVSPIRIIDLITKKSATTLVLPQANFIVTLPGGRINSGSYAKSEWATGSAPFNVAHGDFNGDGLPDVVTANYGSNNVSFLIRNTTNTGFNPKVDYPVGITPRMVIVADFNGDGRLDIATASNGTSREINVLIRNQNAVETNGFSSEPVIVAPYQLSSIASGDINGDGVTDLIAVHYNNNSIKVYQRNAFNSGFIGDPNVAVGNGITNGAVGDLNGDGKLDIAVCNWNNNTVSILYRNAGNTGFTAPSNLAIGISPRGIAIADFNGDGKADIVTGNHQGSNVSVLIRNAANSGFNTVVNYPIGAYVQWVVPGDFNNDGKIDIGLNVFQGTDPNADNIFVMVNNGNGTFQTPLGFHIEGFVRAITMADFNADGQDDIFVPNYSGTSGVLFTSHVACWKGAVSNAWDNIGNWWGGKLPTSTTEIKIFDCSRCPSVQSDVNGERIAIVRATVETNGFSLTSVEDTSIQQTHLVGKSTWEAADFSDFGDNQVSDDITIIKTGGELNNWKGNNEFKGQLKIMNNSAYAISPNAELNNVVVK